MTQANSIEIPISASSSTGVAFIDPDTSTTPATLIEGPRPSTQPHKSRKKAADIEKAVYLHIKAIRSMGRTKINSLEIASALGVQNAAVAEAIASLRDKGVKVIG